MTQNKAHKPSLKHDVIHESDETSSAVDQKAETERSDPQQDIAELQDRLLRAAAEMDNLRKRQQREIQEIAQYAVTNFARDMLGVADNLERAMASMLENKDLTKDDVVKAMVEGIEMTLKGLMDALVRHGVKKVNSQQGAMFDHNIHQAMMEVPNSGIADGAIVQVFQEGYILHERLLRPALVSVARNKPETSSSTSQNGAFRDGTSGTGQTDNMNG